MKIKRPKLPQISKAKAPAKPVDVNVKQQKQGGESKLSQKLKENSFGQDKLSDAQRNADANFVAQRKGGGLLRSLKNKGPIMKVRADLPLPGQTDKPGKLPAPGGGFDINDPNIRKFRADEPLPGQGGPGQIKPLPHRPGQEGPGQIKPLPGQIDVNGPDIIKVMADRPFPDIDKLKESPAHAQVTLENHRHRWFCQRQ